MYNLIVSNYSKMNYKPILVENKILLALITMIILGVTLFDIFHFSIAYGIVEINPVNSLFLIPFITLICGFGILLGKSLKQDEMQTSYQKRLSTREKEVMEKVINGKKNKEIAEELFISLATVKTHISKIYKKTGVQNRKQLINHTNQVVKKD